MINNYGTIYKVEQYNDSAFRLIKLYHCNRLKSFISENISNSEDSSLSRTKRNIRRICLSNNFEYFATWTINSEHCDRFFLTDCVEKMKTLLKAYQRKNKNFKYLYVIEKHKNRCFSFSRTYKRCS